MSNQVTVRFESTPEVNNNRTYYEKIVPFVRTKDTQPEENKEYFIVDPNSNIFVKVNHTIFSDTEEYYEKNYIFLKGESYYIYNTKTNSYDKIQNITEINANLEYYIENNVFLVSGPVEIFATVDVLYSTEKNEETGNLEEIAHPTIEEMQNSEYFSDDGIFDISLYMAKNPDKKIGLFSPFVTELVRSDEIFTNKNNYIIFVEDVSYDLDSQTHRGAYFYYAGCIETDKNVFAAQWTEILLGTHSHTNPDRLENLSNLPLPNDTKKSLILLNHDGSFSTIDYQDPNTNKFLPDLPLDYQEELTKIEKYNSINEPLNSESHHLDAPLELLADAYDYIYKDENGSYINPNKLSIGNCRELYRNLIRDNKKVFINKDLDISFDNGDLWVQLEAVTVNFDTTKIITDGLNTELSPQNKNQYILTIDFKWPVSTTDKTIIFVGSGDYYILKPELDYSIIDADYKTATLLINKSAIVNELETNFTFLFLRYESNSIDDSYIMELYNNLYENGNILNDINDKLLKAYVEGTFNRKPNLKPLYLTTDEYGKITWANKLLPTQTFYYNIKEITSENILEENKKFRLIFEDVNYKADEDFPLLMLDDLFLFDAKPLNESGKDLIYELPLDGNHYSIELSNDPLEILGTATLVVIKNTGAVTDELAKNYLTKEDAIKLVSRGKINLDEFAKKSDLINFSKINHIHDQYSLKGHNHDYRYANFKHTHPEITTLISSLEIFNKENFEEMREEFQKWMDQWLKEIEELDDELFAKLIASLGLIKYGDEYYISDQNILIKEKNLIEDINEILIENNIEPFNTNLENIYLYDILSSFVLLFKNNQVWADKVKLRNDIPIFLKNGPIGGLDYEKAKSKNFVYKKDSDLEDILHDIINPRNSLYEVREILTPSKEFTKINFYTKSTDDGKPILIENPEKIRKNYTGMLLFTVEPRNRKDGLCKYKVIDQSNNNTIKEISIGSIIVNNYEQDITISDKKIYYIYDRDFNSNNINYNKKPIQISWNNFEITDNYGQLSGMLIDSKDDIPDNIEINIFEEKNDEFTQGDIVLAREYPAYYIGNVNSLDLENISTVISNNFIGYYENSKQKINLKDNKFIVVAINSILESKNIVKVLDKNFENILDFFSVADETISINGITEISYVLFYYKVSANIQDIELIIQIK